MISYKNSVPDQFVNLITAKRDKTVKKEHIETAFASFKLFCNDPVTGEDAVTSCKKDLAGFFFFVQIKDWSVDRFASNSFDNVLDDKCYSILLASKFGYTGDDSLL